MRSLGKASLEVKALEKETTGAAGVSAVHDSYPLRTVTRLTGLSADLIRVWERRYGVVAPVRGPRGARLYTNADIAHLKQLADLVAQGRAIGDVAVLSRTALEQLRTVDSTADLGSSGAISAETPYAKWQSGFFVAVEGFDGTLAANVLWDASLALGSRSFLNEIVSPLLVDIGERWADGRLSIGQEHFISCVLRNFLGSFARLRGLSGRPVVLLATPSGERHELGAIVVGLLLLEFLVPVVSVGSDLPAAEILAVADEVRPSVVALSVASESNRTLAVEEIRLIEAGLPADVQIWLGGGDADHVIAELGDTRAVCLSNKVALEREIGILAKRIV